MTTDLPDTEFEKASRLSQILIDRATGLDASNEEFIDLRHQLISNKETLSLLPKWIKIYRSLDSFWGFIQPKYPSYVERRKFLAEEFAPVLNHLEFGFTTLMENTPELDNQQQSSGLQSKPISKKKVFIVHGHENEAKQEVSRYIESLEIDTIILHEKASQGMTIIEKIEHYSSEADFAVILYTPCDRGRGALETKIPARNRARQNVVFEHGYLIAKLGRKNVCALVKGEIEKPNDISGVVYVDIDPAGAWKTDLNL